MIITEHRLFLSDGVWKRNASCNDTRAYSALSEVQLLSININIYYQDSIEYCQPLRATRGISHNNMTQVP